LLSRTSAFAYVCVREDCRCGHFNWRSSGWLRALERDAWY